MGSVFSSGRCWSDVDQILTSHQLTNTPWNTSFQRNFYFTICSFNSVVSPGGSKLKECTLIVSTVCVSNSTAAVFEWYCVTAVRNCDTKSTVVSSPSVCAAVNWWFWTFLPCWCRCEAELTVCTVIMFSQLEIYRWLRKPCPQHNTFPKVSSVRYHGCRYDWRRWHHLFV